MACQAADKAEVIAIHPAFFILFNVCIAAGISSGFVDFTNIAISIVTADLMLLLLTKEHRENRIDKAQKAELLAAVPGARRAEEVEREVDCERS